MLVSFFALGVNLGCNYLFVIILHWGHQSLALTTSITACLNFLILFAVMRRFSGGLDTASLLAMLAKLLLAGSVLAGVCLAANHFLLQDPGKLPLLLRLGWLSATVGVAAAAYFLTTKLLRVPEADEALAMLLRKVRR